jgi:hypothetical protein
MQHCKEWVWKFCVLQICVYRFTLIIYPIIRNVIPKLTCCSSSRPVQRTFYPSMALQSFLLDLGRFFSFLILYIVGLLRRGSARRKAATYTQNKRTQTSMPWVGFEPTIPAFERAKTVHALDLLATVIAQFREPVRWLHCVHKRLIKIMVWTYDSECEMYSYSCTKQHIVKIYL